jgi:hypothetical protein
MVTPLIARPKRISNNHTRQMSVQHRAATILAGHSGRLHHLAGRALRSASRSAKLRATVIAAVGTVALGICVVPAGATTLVANPEFDCFNNGNGTASITMDKLPVSSDGFATAWRAEIFRWNGSWDYSHPYYVSPEEGFVDTWQGELNLNVPMYVKVAPDSYYEEVVDAASNDGKGVQAFAGVPGYGVYTVHICTTY